MAKKEPKGDYVVGYGRPPKAGQIKPGEVRNPWGCLGKNNPGKLQITSILEEPLRVRTGNKVKKMHVSEAGIRSLVNQAIKEKKIAAAIEFIELCDENNLLAQPEGGSRRLVMPKDYDYREWLKMLETYGPPPWPGEHNGLPKQKPHLVVTPPSAPKPLPNPLRKSAPSRKKNMQELLYEIASQRHWVSEDGKRRKRSVLELVLMVLRSKVAQGHRRARRRYDRLVAKYGTQEITYGGLLHFEEITEEEWEKMFGNPEPDSAA